MATLTTIREEKVALFSFALTTVLLLLSFQQDPIARRPVVDSTRMVHSFHPVIIIYRTQY
jgi:hypothetical protein